MEHDSVHARGTSTACSDDFMREPSATPMGTVDTIPTTKISASSSHARASRIRSPTTMIPGMTIAMRPSERRQSEHHDLADEVTEHPIGRGFGAQQRAVFAVGGDACGRSREPAEGDRHAQEARQHHRAKGEVRAGHGFPTHRMNSSTATYATGGSE